jgi:hypothetical protein
MSDRRRRHLEVRLKVQLRTVELNPDWLEAADELERIRAELLALDVEELQAGAPYARQKLGP